MISEGEQQTNDPEKLKRQYKIFKAQVLNKAKELHDRGIDITSDTPETQELQAKKQMYAATKASYEKARANKLKC